MFSQLDAILSSSTLDGTSRVLGKKMENKKIRLTWAYGGVWQRTLLLRCVIQLESVRSSQLIVYTETLQSPVDGISGKWKSWRIKSLHPDSSSSSSRRKSKFPFLVSFDRWQIAKVSTSFWPALTIKSKLTDLLL